jgi:hypothetical protein
MTRRNDAYNYETFSLAVVPEPETFPGPQPGESIVDFTALRLADGARVRLSDYLGKVTVLETGSVTCPLYVDKVARMNSLRDRYPDVSFLLLYTHEAHPGERIGPHCSLDDKKRRAELAREVVRERREILVDDLDGSAHRAYGGFPNLLYLIGEDGVVLLRGHWSDPRTLDEALRRLSERRSLRGLRFRFRYPNPLKALLTLLRGGKKAVIDGARELPRFLWWHRRESRVGHG